MNLQDMETKICHRSLNQLYANCMGLKCIACRINLNTNEYYCADLKI